MSSEPEKKKKKEKKEKKDKKDKKDKKERKKKENAEDNTPVEKPSNQIQDQKANQTEQSHTVVAEAKPESSQPSKQETDSIIQQPPQETPPPQPQQESPTQAEEPKPQQVTESSPPQLILEPPKQQEPTKDQQPAITPPQQQQEPPTQPEPVKLQVEPSPLPQQQGNDLREVVRQILLEELTSSDSVSSKLRNLVQQIIKEELANKTTVAPTTPRVANEPKEKPVALPEGKTELGSNGLSGSSNSVEEEALSRKFGEAIFKEEEELQDLGSWEDALSKEGKDFVTRWNLSKRTFWDFGDKEALGPDDIKALCDAMQQAPKTKKISRIRLNFSSQDIRLRSAKEFAVALLENVTVKQLILHDPRRQTCWTLLTHLVEGDSSILSVVLEDLDLPEAWSGAQCVKILGSCKWAEFIIENSKKNNNFKREDVNPFYDNIVTGLSTNKTITHFTLRSIHMKR